ncbi:class I SAM-dependent methyltransferase [Streptomyces sp. NPDC018019]|uniref:class I SAM-dependent methyltransferase n=1 Tax=Streptomyces sp. NPDC018019 TaxID=3365030 RepID=UPI0037A75955
MTDTDGTVTGAGGGVTGTDRPVTGTDVPVTGTDGFTTGGNGSASDGDGPASDRDSPWTSPEAPPAGPNAPLPDPTAPESPLSRRFDAAVRAYVQRHPRATVVALGEGLGAAFWRLDNGWLSWLTVEPPETAAVRRMLLPDGPRRRVIACAATDLRWLDAVRAPERGVVVTVRGLLMFLRPPEVRALFAACAERLPGGALVFDSVPRWCVGRDRPRTGARTNPDQPPLRWGLDAADRPRVAGAHPGIVAVREVPPPGRGPLAGRLARWRQHVPLLHTPARTVTEIRFGTRRTSAGVRPGSTPGDPERPAGRRSR